MLVMLEEITERERERRRGLEAEVERMRELKRQKAEDIERFRRIKERAIELSMRQADEGVVGIHHSVFEEMPGQAILLQGGKSLLIQSCSFNDVGAAGSRRPTSRPRSVAAGSIGGAPRR